MEQKELEIESDSPQSRDEEKISILKEKLKDSDTDMLICTYEMLQKKKNFFETEAGNEYIQDLKNEINKRQNLSKHDRQKELIIATILIIVAVIFVVGAIKYGYDVLHEKYIYKESQEEIDELKVMLDISAGEEPEEEHIYTTLNINGKYSNILKKYRKIYEKNNDFIGWISIPGTSLDYPVVQTKDNEYYLKHDFNKDESEIGIPFLDMRNDIEGYQDNFIIYGHNLNNGNMFGCLKNYLDKSYYEKHPIIQFDTLYQTAKYRIVYVALSEVPDKNNDKAFRYFNFINTETEQEFNYAMDEIEKLECYPIKRKLEWGDRFITLSTCNNFVENGRLFVVAKKIE